jgi:hypothetical protein
MTTAYAARDKARAARENLEAKLDAAGAKRPKPADPGDCDPWYEEADAHFAAGDDHLDADRVKEAITEYELGLACQTAGDGCVALKSTLP